MIRRYVAIDLAKPKSWARIFFSRTSQGHNTLSRLGLEPGPSDSEPSALTTRLLNKAVALACPRNIWPRNIWPRILNVAPCTVVRSYGRTSEFFRLDGLLLLCIIMGLRSACSAINGYKVSVLWGDDAMLLMWIIIILIMVQGVGGVVFPMHIQTMLI